MSTGARSDKNAPYFQAVVPGKTHVRSYTNTSSQINDEFQSTTTLVSVFATTDCWIRVGENPTAAVVSDAQRGDSMFLPGGIKDFVGVEPGDKIAVIRHTANGILYVTEAQ